jgi:hypothetical protein
LLQSLAVTNVRIEAYRVEFVAEFSPNGVDATTTPNIDKDEWLFLEELTTDNPLAQRKANGTRQVKHLSVQDLVGKPAKYSRVHSGTGLRPDDGPVTECYQGSAGPLGMGGDALDELP